MNENAKTVRLTVALSEKDAEYIKRVAADNGVTISELIHEVLLGFADWAKGWITFDVKKNAKVTAIEYRPESGSGFKWDTK